MIISFSNIQNLSFFKKNIDPILIIFNKSTTIDATRPLILKGLVLEIKPRPVRSFTPHFLAFWFFNSYIMWVTTYYNLCKLVCLRSNTNFKLNNNSIPHKHNNGEVIEIIYIEVTYISNFEYKIIQFKYLIIFVDVLICMYLMAMFIKLTEKREYNIMSV